MKLRIKYKNDDSEWSEYDDYNYHGYGKYNEKISPIIFFRIPLT